MMNKSMFRNLSLKNAYQQEFFHRSKFNIMRKKVFGQENMIETGNSEKIYARRTRPAYSSRRRAQKCCREPLFVLEFLSNFGE